MSITPVARTEVSASPANITKSSQPLNSIAALTERGLLEVDQQAQLAAVGQRFAVAITPAMADQIDPLNPSDPIARQFVPDPRELEDAESELADPIGDQAHSPLAGIVHRYPDRVLLMPIHICPVYCRFCFRRETVGKPEHALLGAAELEGALDYIRTHTEIWEVILSGGDPLLLSPRRLKSIVATLSAIDHIKVIRIHTRVPVVDPDRISEPLVTALSASTAVYVVLHTNHAQEFSAAAWNACARLIDAGIPMLSQSVLLKGINDSPETLENLFRELVAHRIKPYYLHHADRARGTAHFRTSIAAGQSIMQQLRGRVSGLCQPAYVLDIPGGAGKIPVTTDWVHPDKSGHYEISDYRGGTHTYDDQ